MAQEKDVSRLVLELSADVSKLDRGMRQGQRIAEARSRAIEKSFEQMQKRTTSSVASMGSGIQRAIGGLALAAAAREVQQYADTWTRATNQLMAAGNSQEQAGAKLEQLTGIALRSRSSLEGTITLYNRLIATSGELGVSQDRVARVVETVNKALATSNLSGGERQSAVTQLAQGLGSGTLAGDELKAIRENSVALSQAIADEFGVSIGELKKLGEEGKLTSAKVFQALENATANVETAFGKTRATVDDAFTNLQTKTIQFVGQLDASTGASAKLAEVIGFVANHLDEIAMAAGLATVAVGAGYAAAMTIATVKTIAASVAAVRLTAFNIAMTASMTGATRAQVALNLAMAANPVGLVIAAVAALAVGLVVLNDRYGRAAVAARELNGIQDQTSGFLDRYRQAQFDAANATGENTKKALEHVEALKKEGAEILNVARLNAQRRINEATQARREADRLIQANNRRQAGQGNRSFSNASIIQDQATQRIAQTAIEQALDAKKDADAAIKELEQFKTDIAAPLPSTTVTNRPATETGGSAKKDTGPSPEDIARTRQLLVLEMAMERLKAQGRTYDAEQIQAQIDKINLAKQLKDAGGFDDPAKTAAAQVDSVRQAEAAERGRAAALERTQFFLDAAKTALEAYNEEQDRQLQLQIDIARLEGNDTVVRMLERELRLRQAINALGPDALPEQVAGVRRDNTRLTDAEDAARYREKGQDMAASFISIIRADDIGAEIGNRFRAAAFDKLQDVIGNLFSQLMQAGAGGGGSGGWIGTAARLFGGGRALGGPVKAGMTYKINETTPRSEYFTPAQNGYVGNMPKAKGKPGGVSYAIKQGDIFITGTGDAALRAYVDRAMATTRRQTLADVKAGAPAAQLEQQLLRN